METKQINNIKVMYNSEDWDTNKSKKVSTLESLAISLSCLVSILSLVVCTKIGMCVNAPSIGLLVGLICMMLIMIFMIASVEKDTYGKEITGFRFLDWFNRQNDVKAVYRLSGIEVEGCHKESEVPVKLELLFKQYGCKYSMNYINRHKMSEYTPIEICVDATKKDIISVNVERKDSVSS